MGTTIRRKPITTSIPAAPDYKFLNITNFGGIEKSSNPFVVSSNTASDCLNVYVDEDNALSTRPRLETITNLITTIISTKISDITKDGFVLIGVYNLHNGYLVHGIEKNKGYMFKVVEDKDKMTSVTKITGTDKIKTKCHVFEQYDIIYLLDGKNYKNIIGDVVSDVEGYVPTITIGRWKPSTTKNEDGTTSVNYVKTGSKYESLNLLSNKYKETYFWDGQWDTETIRLSPRDVIENNYVVTTTTSIKDPIGSNWIGGFTTLHKYLNVLSDEDDSYKYFVAQNDSFDIDNNYRYGIVKTDKNMVYDSVVTIPFVPDNDWDYFDVYCSDDGTTVIFAMTNYHGTVNKITIFRREDKLATTFDKYEITVTPDDEYGYLDVKKLLVNNDGSKIVYVDPNYNGHLLKYNSSQNKYTDTSISNTHKVTHVDMDVAGQIVLCELKQNHNQVKVDKFVKFTTKSDTISLVDIPIEYDATKGEINTGVNFKISPSGDSAIATIETKIENTYTLVNTKLIYFKNLTSTESSEVIATSLSNYWNQEMILVFDEDETTVYYHSQTTPSKGGWVNLKTKGVQKNVILPALTDKYPFVSNSNIIATGLFGVVTTTLDLENVEPLLVVTRDVNTLESDVLQSLKTQKDNLIKSTLTGRFDNNTWFASNNITFHTEYNNPTYIPLSSYNDLGEEYEPITGLCVINDNVLAAYKRNRIYIITPVTIGDQLTYSYTETKNVIGNDVPEAPILTILTEMPIVVSHNGVYALNQLENVQSSDRITTLISEAINPKWLKEPVDDINRCITINRLYWTYFILPHKKITSNIYKDKDYTKIYLLDNRTQNWFYWELPIYVMSAMIKHNKTHFVAETGDLYTLEITDIINKYNSDLTEYYDNLKTPSIIPWYWTSQILSLNTINYSKRLVDTTFVVTDTDTSDEYALNYKFKAFRKNKNAETTELTLTNDIEFVESITKRTMIPRFNFLQFTLSNTEDDLNNNKLRLVGLGLKYVLLGGMY